MSGEFIDRPVVLFVNTRATLLESAPAFDAARRLGLSVAVLADRPTNVPHGLEVETIGADTYDARSLVAAAEEVANRRHVVGVAGSREPDIEGTALVAEALGLPGHPVSAVRTAQNKACARTVLQRKVPELTVDSRHVEPEGPIDASLADMPLPAIVKPRGASGSRGVHMVESVGGLRRAVDRVRQLAQPDKDPMFRRHTGGVVVEEYVPGSEHSVEAILEDGRIRTAMVTDKWVEPEHFLEYLQIHPSALDPPHQRHLIESTQQVVTALGLGTGAVHVEYRFHRDAAPRVIEVNARAGGGCITSHLVRLAWDFDFMEALLAVCCDMPAPACPSHPRAVAGSRDIFAEAEGAFRGLAGLDVALANTGVQHVSVDMPLGSEVAGPPVSYTRHELATVVCSGYSHDAVASDLRTAAELIEPIIES